MVDARIVIPIVREVENVEPYKGIYVCPSDHRIDNNELQALVWYHRNKEATQDGKLPEKERAIGCFACKKVYLFGELKRTN